MKDEVEIVLNKGEKAAISTLRRLAKRWPKSLWLYSANGALCVMKYNDDGETACADSGGIDPNYSVTTIEGIPNDGGDW